VTFAKEEREEERWRLREEILLGEVERDILAKLHEMVHLAETSAAQYVEQSIFEHHFHAAQAQYHSFSQLTYPFGTVKKQVDQETKEALIDMWKRAYGDPDDPEVRAGIDATIKHMDQSMRATGHAR
jgi:hypothetical protein